MVLYSMLLSALSQGLLYAPMALGVYITFRILQTPDLTVDGSFVFGMTVSAVVTIAGHPVLALVCGALAGALAGFFTALLQTKLKVEPILSGILVSTGLYTVNYAVLGGQSNLYLQSQVKNSSGAMVNASSPTIYRLFGALPVCGQGFLKETNAQVLVITLCIVILLVAALSVFFFTRPGMAIRATGDNEEMVRSSSINADLTRTAGVMLANALASLSGGQRQAASLLMATIARPRLLLLDEHTAALDPGAAEKVMAVTQQIVARDRITTLMITHDMDYALRVGERTILLQDGRIRLDLTGRARAEMTSGRLAELFYTRTH